MSVALTMPERYAVFPYQLNRHIFPESTLDQIRNDLIAEDLYEIVFHEKPLTREEFLEFMNKSLLMIFMDMELMEYPGFAWVHDIAETSSGMRRGFGAFVFLRRYWNQQIPDMFGRLCLDHWYNIFNFDLICGLTPRPNRLARAYSTRMGFRYIATLPGFTEFKGKRTDSLVCQQTKEEFNERSRRG